MAGATRGLMRRRRRRLYGALAVTVLVFTAGVLAGLAWRDVERARRDLEAARRELVGVASNPAALSSPEGRTAAVDAARTAAGRTRDAHKRLRRSTPLRLAGMVPGLGVQRDGILQLAGDAETATTAGNDLLAAIATLANDTPVEDGRIPLEAMVSLEREVRRTASEFRAIRRGRRGLIGPLHEARVTFDELAVETAGRLDDAAIALAAGRSFAGETGVRRHFVAGLNNAEMRDQGMVLSYAILRFDHGRFAVERSGPIHDLALGAGAPVEIPAGTEAMFGDLHITQEWRSVNATADFPWSAATMVAMYEQATGEVLDGVVGIDAVALGGLLSVTGAVRVDGLGTVSSANAVEVLLARQYDGLAPGTDQSARREQVADVAVAAMRALEGGRHDPVHLGRRLAQAAEGGHLRLWSADEDVEAAFERVGLGGGPAVEGAARTFHVAIQNANGTKLDYEVRPAVRMDVTVTDGGRAVVRTSITVANRSAHDAPPSYARGVDGSYVARVYLWGPAGASQQGSIEESGLRLNQQPVAVAPGDETSVSFETVIPDAIVDGELALRLVPQPRHVPARLQVHLSAPAWRIHGDGDATFDWDRTLQLRWGVQEAP